MSSIFIWGYYGTHCRVRLYPPFGGIVLYIRNIILLGSTTKKNTTHYSAQCSTVLLVTVTVDGIAVGNILQL